MPEPSEINPSPQRLELMEEVQQTVLAIQVVVAASKFLEANDLNIRKLKIEQDVIDLYQQEQKEYINYVKKVEQRKKDINRKKEQEKKRIELLFDPAMHARAVECLGSAFPHPSSATAVTTQEEVVRNITQLLTASIRASVWRVRVAIAGAAGKILVKIVPSVITSKSVEELIRCLRVAADDIKFHQVRQCAIGSLLNFLKRAAQDSDVANMCKSCVLEIKVIVRLLRNDGDPLTAQKAGEAALELEKFA